MNKLITTGNILKTVDIYSKMPSGNKMWLPFHKRPSIYRDTKFEHPFLLSKPKTKKLHGENIVTASGIEIGHSCMQGYRKTMEDQYVIEEFADLEDHTLVSIMDGHAGENAAIYASVRLREVIEETEEWIQYKALKAQHSDAAADLICKALVAAYVAMDEEIREEDTMVFI